MSVLADTLVNQITRELSRACVDHREAQGRRREKDTLANRALVAECSAGIDALLDMYLAARAADPQRCRGRGAAASRPPAPARPAASAQEPPRDRAGEGSPAPLSDQESPATG